MRKIIVLEFITLDGVIQAPGGTEEDTSGDFKFGGWTVPLTDEFMVKVMDGQMSGEYDLLLGRKTYDIWSGYWPQHTEAWPQVSRITKYVVSKTLNNPKWENTVVLQDINELKQLKKKNGSPLQVYGSANLAQTLLKNNLVDELWLKIYPITLGTGKRLFADGTIPKTWKMTKGEIAPNGVIVANFQPAGKVKTGTF